MTKRLLVSLDDDVYEALRRYAFEKNVPMAKLVRHAIDATFEDQLDGILGEMALQESMRDPSSVMTLEDYMRSRELEIPARDDERSSTRSRSVAAKRSGARGGAAGATRRRAASARSAKARR